MSFHLSCILIPAAQNVLPWGGKSNAWQCSDEACCTARVTPILTVQANCILPMQLRGGLRGASSPVNLTALAKSLDLASTMTSGKTVASLVEELISEGAILGVVKAGTNTFVPRVFAIAQQQAVQDFYTRNGFIEYVLVAMLKLEMTAMALLCLFTELTWLHVEAWRIAQYNERDLCQRLKRENCIWWCQRALRCSSCLLKLFHQRRGCAG